MRYPFLFLLLLSFKLAHSQTINSAYAKGLQAKYPSLKADFCPTCKVWINPYFKSIADTAGHRPLVTFYIYTKAHRLMQEKLSLPRTGTYAAWTPGYGQANETAVYKMANQTSSAMIAKGHCQAWILLAWCIDAAILSDTYTFNAAMEYQGQNIGTEIATEEFCRKLTGYKSEAVTDSVYIWCGTFGEAKVYTKGKLSNTLPTHYYKIIKYRDDRSGTTTQLCYWMPNLPEENRDQLAKRMVSHEELIAKLGFDPVMVFKSNDL